MTYSSCRSYLLNVDQLTDVHVVVTAAHVRPNGLHHLPNHGHNDVSPGQRQGLAVQQLLEQRHHVAVVGRAGENTAHLHPCNFGYTLPLMRLKEKAVAPILQCPCYSVLTNTMIDSVHYGILWTTDCW